MINKQGILLLLLLVLVLVLSGCMNMLDSKDGADEADDIEKGERIEEADEAEEADQEEEVDDGVDFTDSLFGDMDLPEGFPADYLLIPDKSAIDGTNTMTVEDTTTLIVEYMINSSVQEIEELYEDNFIKKGLEREYLSEAVQGDYTTVSANEDNKIYIAQILDVQGGMIRVILTYQEN